MCTNKLSNSRPENLGLIKQVGLISGDYCTNELNGIFIHITHYIRWFFVSYNLTPWLPGGFGDFWKKQHLCACGFMQEFLWYALQTW